MDNNLLLTFVIYYSLFNKKLFDNESKITKSFPKNVFGVFSTIRRFHKIKTFPIDIHGCIGYWDTDFKTLSNKILYTNLLNVSYDSLWKDERRNYFNEIYTDPYSFLELDFMLNPIYKINKDNGIIIDLNQEFTNTIFGIIIQTKDKQQKATYLPNVFPNITWKKLLISIKNKANITSDNFNLFAYKITQIKTRFITLLTDDIFSYISLLNFSRLLMDNIKLTLKYPFIYSCNNNLLEYNSTDDVRNISTLSDLLKYNNLYKNIINKTELNIIKNKILNILYNINKYSSQSLSFLGDIYALYDINNKEQFCEKLLKDLPLAEDEFEKPEIIIGLNKAGCFLNKKDYILTYTINDSIFKMNWIIQSLISFNKKLSSQLVTILENKVNNILMNKKITETNYLAVAFEALCFLYGSIGKLTLLDTIFELLFELETRKTCFNVLYSFLDKTSRVDITCHINNGLYELRKKVI
jgi:hypothetical protein